MNHVYFVACAYAAFIAMLGTLVITTVVARRKTELLIEHLNHNHGE
ncbi:MAG: hypothetical protein AAF418_01205 [Pseudomonadota bacterium]